MALDTMDWLCYLQDWLKNLHMQLQETRNHAMQKEYDDADIESIGNFMITCF